MATIDGNLWEYNLARVIVVDVTDDYRFAQMPLPNDCYPVLAEMWVPLIDIDRRLAKDSLLEDYLYDWHQSPDKPSEAWYVGVVHSALLNDATIFPPL